jgi:hypothetical protein
MTAQVRQAMEKSNKKGYGQKKVLRFHDVRPDAKEKGAKAVCNQLRKKENLAPRAVRFANLNFRGLPKQQELEIVSLAF